MSKTISQRELGGNLRELGGNLSQLPCFGSKLSNELPTKTKWRPSIAPYEWHVWWPWWWIQWSIVKNLILNLTKFWIIYSEDLTPVIVIHICIICILKIKYLQSEFYQSAHWAAYSPFQVRFTFSHMFEIAIKPISIK